MCCQLRHVDSAEEPSRNYWLAGSAAETVPTNSSRYRPTERGRIIMERTDDRRSETANEAGPTPAGAAPAETRDGSRSPQAEGTAHPDHQAADPATNPSSA